MRAHPDNWKMKVINTHTTHIYSQVPPPGSRRGADILKQQQLGVV